MEKKQKRLNQVLATEKELKTNGYKRASEIYKTFQKPEHFNGFAKTYRKKDEGDEKAEDYPPEKKVIQHDAAALLDEVRDYMQKLFDVEATKDYANCSARADVTVDGKVILQDAPATLLLFLEKQLRDLRAEVEKVPVLDSADAWVWDKEARTWKTGVTTTHKTKKEPRVVVKFEPTEHQPGQADVFHDDRVVGYWDTVKMSSSLSATRKKQLLDRIDRFAEAVKHAREEANEAEAPSIEIGAAVLDYVFQV
jgi:transcriptional regulator NrdR family protein